MRLAPASHEKLETFLRSHFRDEGLELPRFEIHAGRFAVLLTRTFGVGAITFAGRVLVDPALLRRGGDGRLCVPGALAAHEATHVLQYAKEGRARFLFSYLREYTSAFRKGSGRGVARHWAAYRAISFEAEAGDAEHAYALRARESGARGASGE